MKKTYLQRGFTLIELLVVIAIIGLLSSVVLASLSTARNRGNDAKVKAQLSSVRSAVELYAVSAGKYAASTMDNGALLACTGTMFIDIPSGLKNLTGDDKAWPDGTTLSCQATDSAWAVSARLSGTGGVWCVDSKGKSQRQDHHLTSGQVACP